MTYRSIVLPLGAAVIFGGLLFVKSYGNKQMNAYFDNMPQPPVTISAVQVARATWPLEVQAVGTFAAVKGADLATEVGGIVESIGFENGAKVKAGEPIMRLDTDVDVAQLNAFEAAARLAELELERIGRLIESRSVSEADMDAARSRADQARANVAEQRARIAQKTIVAPFGGKLGIRKVNLGQYVDAGTAVVSLQSLDPIFLNFTLPEQRLVDVSAGQPVVARLDVFPERSFAGAVTAIEPEVDGATRNFMVQATVENPEHELRPGMFARVELEYGEPQDVLTVPQTAISFNPYGNSVYIIREAAVRAEQAQSQVPAGDAGQAASAGGGPPMLTVTQRFVRTGARRGDLIAIEEGLEEGERIATSGLLKLRNDAVVNINNKVRPEADATPTPPNS